MPELPEVETVRATLAAKLINLKITKIQVLWDNIISYPSVDLFCSRLEGQQFIGFERRGKYLIFVMEQFHWVAHLRMEGKFFIYDSYPVLNKHQHIVFTLSNNQYLVYQDTRKFGKMYLYFKNETISCLAATGKEFFDSDMNLMYLKQCIGKKKIALKTFLLDQHLILGVGNIYADEICFLLGKHPRTMMHNLSDDELLAMIKFGKQVLSQAIEAGGTTIRSYQSALAVDGRFQLQLNVHQRQHQPCKVCQTAIIKEQFNGRGTYYCPWCQPLSYHRIGITGVIGSGKSTVTNYLSRFFPVLYSDQIVDELIKTNDVKQSISRVLSLDLSNDHMLNKQLIAEVVFSDAVKRKALEAILHPLVKATIMNHPAPLLFVEVPLLFEVGWEPLFDAVIVVSAASKVIEQRLLKRGMNFEEQKRRSKLQWRQHQKVAKATFVIHNSDDIISTYQQIDEVIRIVKGKSNVASE
jgi:formamidopyrimidine-DNA glycosylase